MKKCFFCLILSSLLSWVFCQNSSLLITPHNIRIVPDFFDGERTNDFSKVSGYHLYVKKLDGIESIMLTETTKDPSGKNDNYAYRALEYNSINGDEIRFLNGKKLESEYAKYSLLDSTAEPDEEFGMAFHIYIPATIQFGYPWARNGKISIGRGTFLNIRSFEKKYADYTGKFFDNPYMFDLGKAESIPIENPVEIPVEEEVVKIIEPELKIEELPEEIKEPDIILTDEYNPIASEKFQEISDFLTYSKGPETIIDDIMNSIDKINPKDKVDIVFVIDSTGSMKDDIEKLRKEWIPRLIEKSKEFKEIRFGLLLYRDYGDNYKFKGIPVKFFNFTKDLAVFTKNLNGFTIRGNEGGDIPEAVYEALYGGIEFYEWQNDAYKKIILIGDAEPHPTPRGTKKYTKELVTQLSKQKNIHIDAIITPDDKSKRGR